MPSLTAKQLALLLEQKVEKEVHFSGGIYTEVNRGERPCSADQNYLEASLISFPNACWRAFKKGDVLKMKAHSKPAIQNAYGGILP